MTVLMALCLTGGCRSTAARYGGNGALSHPERLCHGYTIVLPGLMGSVPLDHGIVKGLADADLNSAIEMYDWTNGPLLFLSNLRGLKRNRGQARKVAEKIVAYQDQYPGRPVHLVGYSAGGGMAVLTLEALPSDRKVTSTVLLAPTLSPEYDLRLAMSHTESGIHSFYSPIDAPFLMAISTALGTTDGRHTFAAGAVGFKAPIALDAEQRRQYEQALTQQKYALSMMSTGHIGGHFGWTQPAFVKEWLSPLVSGTPAPTAHLVSYRQSASTGDHLPRGTGDRGGPAPPIRRLPRPSFDP